MIAVLALVAGLAAIVLVQARGDSDGDRTEPPGPAGPGTTGPRVEDLEPSGALTLDQPGQVVEGLDVAGCIRVQASDLVIRDVRVRCGEHHGIWFQDGATGGTVEHVEVDGLGQLDSGIKGGDRIVVRRVDIHDSVDGIKLGTRSSYEDSWVHDLHSTGASHNDGMQMTAGESVTIRGNRIDLEVGPGMNAGIWLAENDGPILDVLVEGNRFDGGGYHLKVGGGREVVARDNVHGDRFRWGVYFGDVVVTGATWGATGEPIPAELVKGAGAGAGGG